MCATNCIILAYITIVFRSLNDDYHIQNVHVCKFDFVTGELDNRFRTRNSKEACAPLVVKSCAFVITLINHVRILLFVNVSYFMQQYLIKCDFLISSVLFSQCYHVLSYSSTTIKGIVSKSLKFSDRSYWSQFTNQNP